MQKRLLILQFFLCVAAIIMADTTTVVSLSLKDCEQMALQNSVAIKNAHLDVLAAKEQKKELFAQYFPSVSINAFGFYALDPYLQITVDDILSQASRYDDIKSGLEYIGADDMLNATYKQLQRGVLANVVLTQPVFVGGRIWAGNKLAKVGVKAAVLSDSISARDAIEEVEKNYWQVVSLNEKYKTLLELQALLDTVYRDVNSAVAAGLATENDLLQVEIKRAELRSGLLQLQSGERLSKMNLFNTIGYKYSLIPNGDNPFIDDIKLNDVLDTIGSPLNYYVNESEMLSSQYEAQLLNLAVEAKQLEKRIALGEVLPQVALGAMYGYHNILDKNSWNGAAFVTVSIPITDWGKASRKLKRLDYQIEKAENERQFLTEQVSLQLSALWVNVTTAYSQFCIAADTQNTAKRLFDEQFSYYRAGLISLNELMQTQTQYRQTVENYIDKLIDYKIALQTYINRIK